MTEQAGSRSAYYHKISWDTISLSPLVVLKDGIYRKSIQLSGRTTGSRADVLFVSDGLELRGRWQELDESTSRLSCTLTNTSDASLQLARLSFPAENGLEDYLGEFQSKNISFLRNGYQSWSTARSYRAREKPLRPWLQPISIASSNLANLPSNVPGLFDSEMYAVVADLSGEEAFLVGQAPPFNQFFYIRLNLFRKKGRRSYFELTYDFGRKLISPGQSVDLDDIVFSRGRTHEILDGYFSGIRSHTGFVLKTAPRRGWCSWYYYFNRITPEIIIDNVRELRDRNVDVDFVQIDDGYQSAVGDWLVQQPAFRGRMPELADSIRKAGYVPGIWIAPFIADSSSELFRTHPEYVIRNEYGKRLLSGWAMFWKGKLYYGLDLTHPRVEEYLRKVIRTMVHTWGFGLLKCDFLFGGCLRGGDHDDIRYSRAEILKKGMNLIREEAGKDTFIIGCGMPLSPGIGMVDAMRVGPDTGPYWIYRSAKFFRTGAMMGARNSIRNTLVRAPMHSMLWMNDPDCVMVRERHTKLSRDERLCQINAAILSGGLLTYSDDVGSLSQENLNDMERIRLLHDECSLGRMYPMDLMEREVPELIYNTAGFIGLFNFRETSARRSFDLSFLTQETGSVRISGNPQIGAGPALADVWTGETVRVQPDGVLTIEKMPRHSSRLFRVQTRQSYNA